MSERAIIESKLRKKQAEVAALEEKLRSAKVYVSALNDILKALGGGSDAVETKLRAGSAVAQARDIILSRGGPVHIDDLLRSMGKEPTRDAKASLAGSLAAYVRKDDIFSRPAPNTYGLIELGHATVDEDEQPDEPPPSFGRPQPAFDPEIDEDVPF